MNSNSRITLLLLSMVFTISVSGQSIKPKVYVWSFTSDDSVLSELIRDSFEEALVKSKCYQVLERRNYAALAQQVVNEKMIEDMKGLSSKSKKALNTIEAEIVVFGKITHDKGSGEYRISVKFQRFDSTIEKNESKGIRQGLIADADSREKAITELMAKICPAPQTNDFKEFLNILLDASKDGFVNIYDPRAKTDAPNSYYSTVRYPGIPRGEVKPGNYVLYSFLESQPLAKASNEYDKLVQMVKYAFPKWHSKEFVQPQFVQEQQYKFKEANGSPMIMIERIRFGNYHSIFLYVFVE